MAKHTTETEKPDEKKPRGRGFLGFETNTFDRYFISVVLAIATGLLYLRFLEPLGVPSILSWLTVVAVGYFVVKKG